MHGPKPSATLPSSLGKHAPDRYGLQKGRSLEDGVRPCGSDVISETGPHTMWTGEMLSAWELGEAEHSSEEPAWKVPPN